MIIRKAKEADYAEMMKAWESSVRETHTFLKEEDFIFYKRIIPINYFPNLDLYILDDGGVTGFIGISTDNIEMLFVDARLRGKGYGKALLNFVLDNFNIIKVDVNEQNEQAILFYQKMGFVEVGRSEKDSMNKDYPILHLEYKNR